MPARGGQSEDGTSGGRSPDGARGGRSPDGQLARPTGLSPASIGWLVLPAQVVLAGAVLFVVGFAYVFTGSLYDGFTSWFGYVLIPAIGAGLTVPIVVVVGLPLRIARPVRRWWMTHGGWFTVLSILGLAAIAGSYLIGSAGYVNEPATADTPAYTVFVPDSTVFLTGWFVLAFGLVHFWWPWTWRTRAARAAALARFAGTRVS